MRTTSSVRARALTAALAALLLATSGALAASPSSVTVTTVGGKAVSGGAVAGTLTGPVTVRGTATVGSSGPAEPAPRPLVADAGDSSYVAIGQAAWLLGTGYGGVEPYSFAWSATAGIVGGATSPTASFDTTGLAAGTYTIGLKVTDAAGSSASDTVKIAVYDPSGTVISNASKNDATPGVLQIGIGGQGFVEFPFTVPAGVLTMDVAASWTLPANDYDLRLVDPTGAAVAGPGLSAGSPETITVGNPKTGAWKAILDKFSTIPDTVTVKVTGTSATDPRPSVATTGPYKFLTGATQRLDGTVSGGTAPLTVGWDLDGDGRPDKSGTSVTASLPEGRTLVTLKATDAKGFERRQTTSVLVGSADRLARSTTAITVIGIADSGINPYHMEYSAQTYPDPDLLALTKGFTRHPSEYISGYPATAQALPITLGQGYYPARDKTIWSSVKQGQLYWIPGTKIIGAIDANDAGAQNAEADGTPILDDDGHGTGTTSVSTGNRYGYCPTCLLFFVEGLDETVTTSYPFVDVSSFSFGYTGGAPLGPVVGPNTATKAGVERGQTVMFAAGNGVGNAFDVPVATWGSDQTGASWNIVVGALRRDNQRAIVGDGIPVDISAWGDGNLPSACRTGTISQCAFGGTSAATPYTAGVFGTVLTKVRQALGDGKAGQRAGQVVAEGAAIPGSVYLDDGKLTRAELRDAVLKTAFPLNQDNKASVYPFPQTAPYVTPETNMLFEGYGAATPESAKRAVDVILGRALVPERSFEDQFNALDQAVRDTLYGGYDRDGDGDEDFQGLAGTTLTPASVASVSGTMAALRIAADKLNPAAAALTQQNGQNALTYFLHRRFTAEPDATPTCAAHDNESYMDETDTTGDLECFENRVTSVAAAFRPLGIYPTSADLDAPLPAGSDVYATIYVADENPAIVKPTAVLMAGDREIGTGTGAMQPVLGTGTGQGSNAQGNELPAGPLCDALGELCWTKFDISFETTRPAFRGEQLTFQVQLLGARAWAFGHEGQHASKVAIVAAPMPASGLDFGATIDEPTDGSRVVTGSSVTAGGRVTFPDLGSDPTGAGDHPTTRRVEVSLDDPSFASLIPATIDEGSGTWTADLGSPAEGSHRVYARAAIDQTYSSTVSASFSVAPAARVEWQVAKKNAAPDPSDWRTADGLDSWTFAFDTSTYGKGDRTIVVRLVSGGLELARSTVRARFG
jgi:hypothetical protein